MNVSTGHAGSFRVPRGVCGAWVRSRRRGQMRLFVARCCAVLRVMGGMCHRDTETQRKERDGDCRFGGWVRFAFVSRWRALEQVGATGVCLPSPSARKGKGRWGRFGKAEDDVGLRARMGPLPRGRVVRGHDEDSGRSLFFGRILRVF